MNKQKLNFLLICKTSVFLLNFVIYQINIVDLSNLHMQLTSFLALINLYPIIIVMTINIMQRNKQTKSN